MDFNRRNQTYLHYTTPYTSVFDIISESFSQPYAFSYDASDISFRFSSRPHLLLGSPGQSYIFRIFQHLLCNTFPLFYFFLIAFHPIFLSSTFYFASSCNCVKWFLLLLRGLVCFFGSAYTLLIEYLDVFEIFFGLPTLL